MICITKHSYERIQERVGLMSLKKIKKIAEEAFNSKEKLPKWFTDLDIYLTKFGYSTYKYTYYNDFVWVFQFKVYRDKTDIQLITVYKSNYKNQ